VINLGSILPVGTIIHSMLTTTQFTAEYGDNWVLADGRSVTGSKYSAVTSNSTIPDMRGTFLRGKDNGVGRNADGDLALGTYTDDKFESHVHQQQYATPGANIPAVAEVASGGSHTTIHGTDIGQSSSGAALNTIATGGNETSPKSTIVNIFIRIN